MKSTGKTGGLGITVLIIVGILVSGCSNQAFAWGGEGHRLIARLAETRLSPAARSAIQELLGPDGIVGVANWADKIKPERPETAPFHYVNFPRPVVEGSQSERELPPGENIVLAIEGFRRSLSAPSTAASAGKYFGNPSASSLEKREALSFLVHLVGDIHQPMHCAPTGDQGGNQVELTFEGEASNLHKVWDGGLIWKTGLTEDEYFQALSRSRDWQDEDPFERTGSVLDWALESNRIALLNAYALPHDHCIDARYFDANIRIINRRLTLAGKRLADILNEILEPGFPIPREVSRFEGVGTAGHQG